jgi:hypothetical protein
MNCYFRVTLPAVTKCLQRGHQATHIARGSPAVLFFRSHLEAADGVKTQGRNTPPMIKLSNDLG